MEDNGMAVATDYITADLKRTIIENRINADSLGQILNERRRPINEAIQAMNDKFDAENAELIQQLTNAINKVTECDEQLRSRTVEHYRTTGEKRLDEDCSVRVTTKYQYDNAEAVKWAESNAPVLIVKTVDKKAFESLPQVAELPFVEKVETPVAAIAKEFSSLR